VKGVELVCESGRSRWLMDGWRAGGLVSWRGIYEGD
jgi:hypothetical protein